MPVIQGGGIAYDRGANVRQGFQNLSESIGQAQAQATNQKLAQLQEQRDALTRFTTLMSNMKDVAASSNMPVSAFIRSDAGTNYLNQMFDEYSRATGRQVTADDALKMSTDIVTLINDPAYMDRFTTDWFAAQHQSPTGLTVQTETTPTTLGAKQTSSGQAGAGTQAKGAQGGVATGAPEDPQLAEAKLRMKGLGYGSAQLQAIVANPNYSQLVRDAAQSLLNEALGAATVGSGQVGNAPVMNAEQAGKVGTVPTPSGVPQPAVPDISAAAVRYYELKTGQTLAGAPEAQIMAARDYIVRNGLGDEFKGWLAQSGQAGTELGVTPSAQGMSVQEQIEQTQRPNPTPAPAGQAGRQQTQPAPVQPTQTPGAPRVVPTDPQYQKIKDWYKFVTGQNPPGTSGSEQEIKELNDYYNKNKKSFDTWSTRQKSSLLKGEVAPSMTEDEIASTITSVPKFAGKVVIQQVRAASNPFDAVAQVLKNGMGVQALNEMNVGSGSVKPAVEPPVNVAKSATVAGDLIMKTQSGEKLTTKEQMLLKQQAAVAGNWINKTWKGMSDQDKLLAARQVAEEVSTLPAAFLELRYPGAGISALRSQTEQLDATIKAATVKAMGAASGSETLKEWGAILDVAEKKINSLQDYHLGLANAKYKGDLSAFYRDNPQEKDAIDTARKEFNTIMNGIGVSSPAPIDWSAVASGWFGGKTKIVIGSSAPGQVKGPATPSEGAKLGSEYVQ